MIKLVNHTLEIDTEDGDTFILKPVKWRDLDDAIVYQKKILELVLEKNGSFAEILKPSNERFWKLANDLIKLTPITGANFALDKIDSIEDIIKLFICDPYTQDDERGWLAALNPSLFAKLNSLDFYQMQKEVMSLLQETPM